MNCDLLRPTPPTLTRPKTSPRGILSYFTAYGLVMFWQNRMGTFGNVSPRAHLREGGSLMSYGPQAYLVSPGPPFGQRRVQLATLGARYRVPSILPDRRYAEAGGLMSYGSNAIEMYRQAGIYTGRILNGEKPTDMLVLQAAKFEFVINLHTAKLLGLDVPPTLLARADEVIE